MRSDSLLKQGVCRPQHFNHFLDPLWQTDLFCQVCKLRYWPASQVSCTANLLTQSFRLNSFIPVMFTVFICPHHFYIPFSDVHLDWRSQSVESNTYWLYFLAQLTMKKYDEVLEQFKLNTLINTTEGRGEGGGGSTVRGNMCGYADCTHSFNTGMRSNV